MLPGQEAASVDNRSLPNQGWSLIWINAILMIPLIFGVMLDRKSTRLNSSHRL